MAKDNPYSSPQTKSMPDQSASSKPPLPLDVRFKLSVMMFLQYAIWGAWLPLVYPYLTGHLGFSGLQAGQLIAIGAIGALIAPFVAGQLADRYFSTETFLGISHLVGAVLVWQLAEFESFAALAVFSFFYSFIYAPTLSLTNSLAFHHLPDRDRDFGRVRFWGTVGWIAVGIGIGQWLLHQYTPAEALPAEIKAAQTAGMADAFRLSAILGAIMGLFCFMLPHTPPQKSSSEFAAGKALRAVARNPLLTLFLVAFPIACIHQFYFVHTAGFLQDLQTKTAGAEAFAEKINSVFGVGGGGLMTIGQISELAVLALVPFFAKRFSRKALLCIGLLAYIARFAIFAYLPYFGAILPALALHGLCFGCFFFVAFMIVDEETTSDVRASAQSLFNFVAVGIAIIVGNYFAGIVSDQVTTNKVVDYRELFAIPMWIAIGCLVALLLFYPRKPHLSGGGDMV